MVLNEDKARLIDILKKEKARREKIIRKAPATSEEISREQKSTQFPSARTSPQKNRSPPSPRMKTRRKSINSLRTKSQMSPRGLGTISRQISPEETSQISSPKCRIPKIPPLTLDDDKIEINDADYFSKVPINRETSRIDKKIYKALDSINSPEIQINHAETMEKLETVSQDAGSRIQKFEEEKLMEKKSLGQKSAEKIGKELEKSSSEEIRSGKKSSEKEVRKIFSGKLEKILADEKSLEKNFPQEEIARKSIMKLEVKASDVNCVEKKCPRGKSPEQIFKNSGPSSTEEKCSEKNSPEEKSPRLPQNIMKAMKTSCNRNTSEKEEKSVSSSRSETPKNLPKTSHVLRNISSIENNSARDTNAGIVHQVSSESREKNEDHRINDFGELPLTGDPEIDEEIIAFYRAKRGEGAF